MTCQQTGCDYEAVRETRGKKYCEVCYLEKTAVDVRKVQRTLAADSHTADMFGSDE